MSDLTDEQYRNEAIAKLKKIILASAGKPLLQRGQDAMVIASLSIGIICNLNERVERLENIINYGTEVENDERTDNGNETNAQAIGETETGES